jgi:hypothetical protein
MPRSSAIAVENNFSKGLITEASGMNFPENACTDTDNCVFQFDGSVTRRKGFDFEDDFTTKNVDRSNSVVKTYLWKNVAGNGDVTLLVVQIGNTLYFYKTTEDSLSAGAILDTVTLTPVSGAPVTSTIEAQFADGNGLLFVTHPYIEPMRISYDTATDNATATDITIKVRDFEGAASDPYGIDERPTATLAALNVHHKYNLYNQGWGNAPAGSSTGLSTTNLTAWDTAFTTMPSNADVMWRFKNSSDAFDTATVPNVPMGNARAPNGHFILTLSNMDRDTASGLSGVTATTTSFQRPSTTAWFAGRVFYSGINYVGVNANIYFTQIIERNEQYGFCYQTNDPTSEDSFDLLPTDGGVIKIPDAGTIFKLYTVPGGLAVFAANGVWFITGSTGLGFSATDYTVQKITHIPSISAASFVDVLGFPCWWNLEGIYIMSSQGGLPQVQSLTDTTIKTFYDDIPPTSKRYARGFYHNIEKKITWLFRSEETEQLTEQYEFDRLLNFNARTSAFYPWTVADGDPNIHSIIVTDASSGAVTLDNVTANAGVDLVVDASANQVVAFTVAGQVSAPADKYLTSTFNGSTYVFTFSETKNADYVDWFQDDTTGVNYDSYFTTGYKLRGEGLRKFQSNWVKIFSDTTGDVSYDFRGKWDYANTNATGRWSSAQTVTHTNNDYDFSSRRLKVRGHGTTLQFHVDSVDGENFDIIGWSTFDTANPIP